MGKTRAFLKKLKNLEKKTSRKSQKTQSPLKYFYGKCRKIAEKKNPDKNAPKYKDIVDWGVGWLKTVWRALRPSSSHPL